MGPAADAFSLGATVLYALTGRLPFGEGGVGARLHRILEARPELAGVDADLAVVLATTLALDPDVRPSATQLVAAFADGGRRAGGGDWPVLDTDAGPFRPAPPVKTLRLPRARRRPLAAALAVIAVIAAGAGAVAVAGALRTGPSQVTDAQPSPRSSPSVAITSTAPIPSVSSAGEPSGNGLAQRLLIQSDLPIGWQLSSSDAASAAREPACGQLGRSQLREVAAVALSTPDGAESGTESLSRFAGAAEAHSPRGGQKPHRALPARTRRRQWRHPHRDAQPSRPKGRRGLLRRHREADRVAGRTSTGHAVYARVGSTVVRVSVAVSAGSVDDDVLARLARSAVARL